MYHVADWYFDMTNEYIHHGYFGMMMGYDLRYHSPAAGFIEKYSRTRRWLCNNKNGLGSGRGGY